ncbi:hypothetical protein N7481_002962 [Penicillium waksmanii]|uniref:uncharacterized protein n=1 Tax=Penicillium waksmanii TaxID=69791 RepID=UPI0025491C07|nr:uncharacterized protein N7481_002962 [Penicillium waksmanii]KAJ5987752.1 hypothetical protein N7481_002962 [Penicillium waksmanii]
MAPSLPGLGLRGLRLKVAMVVLVVMPSFMLFGYNNGSSGGITDLESFVKQFPSLDTVNVAGTAKSQNSINLGMKRIVTACYDLGAILGALSCIVYGDKIGRIRTIICGLVSSIIALSIESSAFQLPQFIVGRLLVGASIGVISVSIPVWQTECSTTKHRGKFVIMEGIFISTGISLPSWITFGFFSAWKTSAQWRVTLVFPACFALLALVFVGFMPESPRWLARKGKLEEAREVLAAVMDKPSYSPEVNAEITHIHSQLEASKGSFSLFFRNSKERYIHRTVLATLAQSMTQWCGCSALIFYTSIVFSNLGFTGTSRHLISAGLVSTFTLGALLPLLLVDRFGRRALFLLGASGMCISMAVMASTSDKKHLAAVSTTFIFLYAASYSIGFLGLPFLYASEIATTKMRSPIMAVAVTGQWLGQFVVGQITPPGTVHLKNHYWIIFAVLTASFIPIVFFFFPETNGRSLEEIDDIFQQSGTFNIVKNARSLPRDSDLNSLDLERKYAGSFHATSKEDRVAEVEDISSRPVN